jgi:hypothetical protein
MSNAPTQWSLSSQNVENRGTIVDKRLTTITPSNTTGFISLNPLSNDPIIKNIEYAIQTDGKITYRVPATLASDILDPDALTPVTGFRQFNSIQEIAGAGIPGYKQSTTLKIKDALSGNLRESTEEKIIKGEGVSPFAQGIERGDQEEGLPLPLTANDVITTEIKGKREQKGGSFGDWRYPLTMNAKRDEKNKQDVIKFTMREYIAPSGLQVSGDRFTGRIQKKEQKGTTLGTVTLPIQPTITDSNSVNWQQDSLNPIELAALDLAQATIESGTTGGKKAIDRIIGTIQEDSDNIRKGLLSAFAGAAIGRNVLARTTGAILNPNIELLFNAPSLRVFNYRFQLSAREEPESKRIQKIIRFFKEGMAVRRSAAELFLVTPNIFEIRYLFKEDNDHPYINRIKTCALTNCSVDYTPTGSYMTFPDGAMVSYAINLTFEELEPIYQDDYVKDGEIGF